MEFLPGFEPVEDDVDLTVKSMHEVPVLNAIWETAVALGYLEIESAVVRPGAEAEALINGSAADKAQAQRNFINVFQLKIGLQGAKPPIWRRVLVPSSMRLDELHEVIQLVFDWLGFHLHALTTRIDLRGTAYGPAEDDDDGFLEETIDESTVPLADLLKRVGDRMTYTYDFGDDWEHRITLEKITNPLPDQVLPSCIGGRGAAPAEDSGGVWGWADKIEAANDPRHPEHAEIREWLGLVDGDTLDPKEFDNDDANDALNFLRG